MNWESEIRFHKIRKRLDSDYLRPIVRAPIWMQAALGVSVALNVVLILWVLNH